eukprot:TRINITY_DN33871_c0_g1_i2.p1 TRINITY_DN33871_c0_g1~~TRINITY_DN33871_c0_g1_i2.p1  ORF type:complete len:431 (-),score=73.29 TRINITY_DN33871_c0_g1_i2:243-1535(-)
MDVRSTLQRPAYVLGGHCTPFLGKGNPDFISKGHPEFGKRSNPSIEEHLTTAVNGALEACGVPADLVDRAWVGNFAGQLYTGQGHLGSALAGAHPSLAHKPCMRVEGACASGGLAFASAVDSIQAGADIVLVAGVEVQTTVPADKGGDYLASASHYSRQAGKLDAHTFPALFAQRARAYLEKYPQTTAEDLSLVAMKAYANAARNPLAQMRAMKMSEDRANKSPPVLKNAELKPFMRLVDCSQVSDGATAVLVVSEEGLRKLSRAKSDAVEVLCVSYAANNLYADPSDRTRLDNVAVAAERAYGRTGVTPEQVQVAEVHDCFTITEILMYEALGFAKAGQGASLVRSGSTGIGGRLPVNTGGGLLAFGHPVGATGVKQILELWRQMKGKCGEYQTSHRPQIGLAANMGGDDKTAVVTLLREAAGSIPAKL